MDEQLYISILNLSSDTREQLRPSDVPRLLDEASEMNCLLGFCTWLLADTSPRSRSAILCYRKELVYLAGSK